MKKKLYFVIVSIMLLFCINCMPVLADHVPNEITIKPEYVDREYNVGENVSLGEINDRQP